jgi:hypothetical protein
MYAKTALHEAKRNYQETKDMVHNIVEFRESWENDKRTKSALGRILKSSLLRSAEIVRKDKRGTIELHSPSLNSKSASYLIGRLLNEPFTIKTMKARRLNKETVSLDVEIKL